MTHLKLEDLTLLAVQPARLEPQASLPAEVEHVQTCPDCEQKIARLKRILEMAAADQTIAPPPAVLRRAIQIFQSRPGAYG